MFGAAAHVRLYEEPTQPGDKPVSRDNACVDNTTETGRKKRGK